MSDLLEETKEVLAGCKKETSDILWIGGGDYQFSWADFEKLANFSYDNGFGGQEVAKDLVIVGEDWWLEREEYDGSERWVFKSLPVRPKENKLPTTLCNGESWATLEEMNRPGGKYV